MKKSISIVSILLHGFFLVSLNLFSVATAFAIVQLTSLPSEKIIQASIALSVNLIIYIFVFSIMKAIQKELIEIRDFSMLATIFLVALALLPAIFYPLHYVSKGYWSSFDNLLAIWPYQIVVNGLCLVLNFFVLRRRSKT